MAYQGAGSWDFSWFSGRDIKARVSGERHFLGPATMACPGDLVPLVTGFPAERPDSADDLRVDVAPAWLGDLDLLPGGGAIAESRPGAGCARGSPFACAGILGSTKRVYRPLSAALR